VVGWWCKLKGRCWWRWFGGADSGSIIDGPVVDKFFTFVQDI